MKVLVTGGAGFIGSHLIDRLIAGGHEVWFIDDLSGGYISNLPEKVEGFTFDLRDSERARKAIEVIRPEVIYHLAANAAENKAQFSPIGVTTRNWNTFINVLTPAIKHGLKRFVFTSSIAVYGALQTPFKETDKPEPEDLYGITKLACEQALKVMSKVHDFEYVIARPHNVYGERQNMRDPYRNVVTIWMNALLAGKERYIYGEGNQERCFSYIDDVIEALYRCGFDDVAGQTFNIGSDEAHTLNGLDFILSDVTGIIEPATHIKDRPQEVKVAIADHTLCKKLLGYNETRLVDGLIKTWEWVKTQGYQEPIYGGIEIDSPKIPQNWRQP